MTISDLGSIGEFISSIAILVTLVYLALQIRENTKTNRVAARQHFADQIGDVLDDLRDPDIYAVHESLDGRGLDEEQVRYYDNYLHKCFVYMSAQYHHHHIGAMDDETSHEVRTYIEFFANRPGVWRWWPRMRMVFGPSFRGFVDEMIVGAKGTTRNA